MANPPIRLTSPRGRLVQGDAFEPQTTDQNGAPLTIKTGPNAGQPTRRWFIGVAFPKADPRTLPYLKQMADFAAQQWPAYFPNGATGQPPMFGCTHPRFSIKIMDGDGVDENGKPNREKEGFAGHWVVKYSTSLQAPGVWQEPDFDEMARITDPRHLPRGYFCRVNHTVQSNENDQRPGMYVNLDKIAISADQAGAAVIQSGPTAAQAFGAAPSGGGGAPAPAAPATPPAAGGLQPMPGAAYTIEALRTAGWTDDQIVAGGYATKAAPLPATPPAPAAPAPAAPTPGASIPPTPGSAPATASPSNPPAPYDGFMGGSGVTPPPVPAAPAAPVRQMLPAAQGASYEDMVKAGWTDEMMVQHGMMAAG